MRPVLAPALLRALRLLLPLAACSWAPVVTSPLWSNPNQLKHLYTSSTRRYFHLQIHPNGHVDGTPPQTVYSAMVIRSVNIGLISIIGAKTNLYLCMRSDGSLFGSLNYYNDCIFKYHWLKNHYEVYESPKYNLLVSLGSDKEPYVPHTKLPPFSQFLPRKNEIAFSEFNKTRC